MVRNSVEFVNHQLELEIGVLYNRSWDKTSWVAFSWFSFLQWLC